MTSKIKQISTTIITMMALVFLSTKNAYAGTINMDINGNSAQTVEILVMLTLITLLPSILIMMTAFTRIIIVLSFLKNAMGLQQTPPNQVLIGIAIFLTLFIMSPVIDEINTEAYQPYKNEEIAQDEFFERASKLLKIFMLKQTGNDELQMYVDMSNNEEVKNPESVEDLPLTVVMPAFVTSELKRAFIIGFLLYIPFLIIDMIVSSVLMSMGMMMLPPVMISMPFKLLLFVVIDGWSLLFKTLITTFNF